MNLSLSHIQILQCEHDAYDRKFFSEALQELRIQNVLTVFKTSL
jgi:hypothetical protein